MAEPVEELAKTEPIQMSLIPKTCGDFDLWCRRHGLRVTNKRRAVAEIALHSKDYPDLDQLRSRIAAVNPRISLATVYNTLRLLVEFGLIERHKFRGSPARYGPTHQVRQGHLIDVQSGRVIEFRSNEIESLVGEVAALLGYRLTGHTLGLYGEPIRASRRRSTPVKARQSLLSTPD